MSDEYQVCGHCGAPDVGSYGAGYGSINETPLCHPNDRGRPKCYDLVTVYKHALPCVLCTAVAARNRQREQEAATFGDHPHTDPGDGRSECQVCGKFIWPATHSCKGVPVTQAARARYAERLAARP